MRKLLVVIAVAAIVALVCGCGGSGDSSNHAESTPKLVPNKHATNVIGWWWHPAGKNPRAEIFRYVDNNDFYETKAVRFITTAKGVRLKVGAEAKVVAAYLRYSTNPYRGNKSHNFPLWDGKGFAPLARTITTKEGKQRQLSLKEVYVEVYNPQLPGFIYMRN